jgi:hypothetical protein
MALPVGLGAIFRNEYSDWKTPEGKFRITGKRKDPNGMCRNRYRSNTH